jgi:hypothetical protein
VKDILATVRGLEYVDEDSRVAACPARWPKPSEKECWLVFLHKQFLKEHPEVKCECSTG